MLQSLYDKYTSNIKSLKGRRYLTITSFTEFVEDTELMDNGVVSDRDPTQIFCYSMMTQINEVDFDKHYQMNFAEFMEAFARLAAKLPGSAKLHEKILDLFKMAGKNCMN